jgi:hypothetical protein
MEHSDFYAGAIAMFAVVLFAKFVTHHVSHKGKSVPSKSSWCRGWCWFHVVCVLAAWVGLAVSLYILAEAPYSRGLELHGRWLVGLAALFSSALLAVDVVAFGHAKNVDTDGYVKNVDTVAR